MSKLTRILIIIGMLTAFILVAVPVHADTANPDSAPTLELKKVYRNLLATGDYLYIWEANIPYATPPSTLVSETFTWNLVALDGTTVLGSTVGFAYHTSGFGFNCFSLYFSASEATTLGLVWGTAYILRLNGNPSVFLTPPVYNFAFSASDYTSLTDSAENKSALASEILQIASDLNVKWALASDYFLTDESETGTVLSLYGQTVFRGCVYGCQSLAPTAFPTVIEDINATDRSWNATFSGQLENQWSGSWVETARNASITLFSTANYDLGGIMILLVACVALVIGNMALTNDVWMGLIDVAFLLTACTRLGVIGLGILGLIASLCVIYIGSKIFRMIVPG